MVTAGAFKALEEALDAIDSSIPTDDITTHFNAAKLQAERALIVIRE